MKNIILKVNNILLELDKDFKPINLSLDEMNKFEQKEIRKEKKIAKSTYNYWYDWLY